MTMTSLRLILLTALFAIYANFAHADTFGSGVNAFDIDFVTIGVPGNPADTTGEPNPVGAVPYSYRIGKFEISEDMVDKANALGGLGVTHAGAGSNKPAYFVSWYHAAKFVNWLNTSTGFAPAYKFDASGNFQLWDIGDAGYNSSNLYRNTLAHYFLPSVDEWYKAAYYDPIAGVYYDFPTGSDAAPLPVASGMLPNTAVFMQPLNPGTADVTMAGGLSPFGTMGQGGNVYEWEETEFDLVNDSPLADRGMRSSLWTNSASEMLSSSRLLANPTGGGNAVGFRVASVIPEPTTFILAALAAVSILVRSRSGR